MSSLAGWLNRAPQKTDVLQAMASACSLPQSPTQTLTADDFAVATTGSRWGAPCDRIAVYDDDQVAVAFAGYLYDEDVDHKRRPAALCLSLYERHGPTCARLLSGSFALAVYDRARGQLHLIADRLASRGLYYLTGPSPVFGTEVKAILEYPGVSRRANPDRVREFLTLELVLDTATYYDHIKQVPGATVLTWEGGQVRATRYWEPKFTWQDHGSLDDHATQIATAIRNATRRACAGHERAGLLLSGGLDSRSVACASEMPLACATIHRTRALEVSLAARIAGALGHCHHFLQVSPRYPLELLTPGTLIGDAMHAFHHAQGLLAGPLIEREGLTMMLTGCFLDGLFQGDSTASGNSHGLSLSPPLRGAPDFADPVEYLLNNYQTASDAVLDTVLPHGSAPEVKQANRETMSRMAADARPYAVTNYDLVGLLKLLNVSKTRCHLNVSAPGRLADEGVLAFDNEAFAAFLALPPHYRYQCRAYARALRLLSPRVAAIPRSRTALPLARSRREELLRHYQGLCGIVTAGVATRMCHYQWFDRCAWPRIGLAFQQCEDWRRALRQRAAASVLVDTGLLDGAGLRQVVEDQIAGRRQSVIFLGTWLTLEEWFARYG